MGIVSLVEGSVGGWSLGSNIMDGNWAEEDSLNRRLARIGFVGSNGSTTKLEVFYGKMKVADVWIGTTGAVHCTEDDMHVLSSKRILRKGEALKIVVREAVTSTNAGHIVLDIKDIVSSKRRSYGGYRKSYRRRY